MRGLFPAAALALVIIAFAFAWENFMRPKALLADYRDEMISFARIDPSLEMQSPQLGNLINWLGTSHSMSAVLIPEKVKTMEPVGCRVLRFRRHDVGLICFRHADGKLLHLFVIDRAMFPRLTGRERPEYSSHEGWMTAAWADGEHAYLIAVQSDQATLESILKL